MSIEINGWENIIGLRFIDYADNIKISYPCRLPFDYLYSIR